MKKTTKNSIAVLLFSLSLALFIFCPLYSVSVEINDGITKSICNVSIFTAFVCPVVEKTNFTFTIHTVPWEINLIVILQMIGLGLINSKKGYIIGIILWMGSWIWLFQSSCIIVNVQSDLFSQFGSVQKHAVSIFVLLTILAEVAFVVFRGIFHFRTKRIEKETTL